MVTHCLGRRKEFGSPIALYIDFSFTQVSKHIPHHHGPGILEARVLQVPLLVQAFGLLFILIRGTFFDFSSFLIFHQLLFLVFSFVLWANNCLLFDDTLLKGEILKGELANNLPSLHLGVP